MNALLKKIDMAGIAGIIVIVFACGSWVVTDIRARNHRYNIEQHLISEKMKEVNIATTNLEALKSALAETSDELALLSERVPEAGKIGTLLGQINQLAKHRRVTLVSLEPQPPEPVKDFIRTPLRLNCLGEFADILYLLWDLERMNRIMVMESMTISRDGVSQKLRVDLLAYVFER
ncbi:MAG: type 4a pilus biogenesis protein PilO [Desulfobacteraceae bacterium]|nr:type 4a pilus biogenesis protein PilO [Desulfobacteraceae bacterium]